MIGTLNKTVIMKNPKLNLRRSYSCRCLIYLLAMSLPKRQVAHLSCCHFGDEKIKTLKKYYFTPIYILHCFGNMIIMAEVPHAVPEKLQLAAAATFWACKQQKYFT